MAYRGRSEAVTDRIEDNSWTATAGLSIVPLLAQAPGAISAPPLAPEPSDHPELDCIRHLLPRRVLALIEQRAMEVGVGADRVVVAWGFMTEETYVTALADWLGIAFEPLAGPASWHCSLSGAALVQATHTGMLPLGDGDDMKIVVTPRLVDSRRLVQLAMSGADLVRRIRLTTVPRLRRFVSRHAASYIESRAVDALRVTHPSLSAAASRRRSYPLIAAAWVAAIAALAIAMPSASARVIEFTLDSVFLAWTGLRLLGFLSENLVPQHPQVFSDESLPIYSIVIALYREASAVKELIAAILRLNYPIEKLDIKLVLEPDDHKTREAVARLAPDPPFEIIIAPAGGPRTKPKALNAALPFARGKFVAVFDAEDRPEPDQLRLALEAFVAGDDKLACVQARLTIDNTDDSWLTRLFTAEYAGLFDVFLPGLAAWRLPLPLGGSSNHFRTSVLRRVGAWDPYNVTEDADLGVRLCRFGYRTAVISSTTYEEAPSGCSQWLRQRTRWFKGWMQCWLVHMRSPRRLARDLGLPGFIVLQLLVGGSVLAALIHVLFAAWLCLSFAIIPSDELNRLWLGFDAAALLFGYSMSAALGIIGLVRRRLLGCAWALLLIPVYWMMLSLAAWRALFQLLRDPYRWDKTEHGLARTSRLGARPQR